MSSLAHLKSIIERKSGAPTLQCPLESFRTQFGFDATAMRRDGFDPSTIELHEQFFGRLESFAGHPLIGEYLKTLTPTESYQASGVWVASFQQIRDSAFGQGGPESELFPHGYISIAGSVGGNNVSLHFPSGRVVWADHERTSDIIDGKVQVLSEDIKTFLTDLLEDKLEQQLDKLD